MLQILRAPAKLRTLLPRRAAVHSDTFRSAERRVVASTALARLRQPGGPTCSAALACCLLVLAGCTPRKPPAQSELERIERLASLPGLRESHDPQLQAELARLVAEQATPELLSAREAARPHAVDLATTAQIDLRLNAILSTGRISLVLLRLDQLYPPQKFTLDPIHLTQALEMGCQFAEPLEAYTALFAEPEFHFQFAWQRGLLADVTFVDHARLAHRLHALQIAQILNDGQIGQVLVPLAEMLKIDRLLAQVPYVVTRLAAAQLRSEAFRVLEAVVHHPQCSAALQAELLKRVSDQLIGWPPDAAAWIGDRAVGLHAYELVRSGLLLSILTQDEIRTLKADRELDAFTTAVNSNVDQDERFYLAAMRRVIDRCSEPFSARRPVFAQLARQLDELRDSPQYPLFAAKVLLPRLESGHRLQALDRARCEAWTLALSAALDRPAAEPAINPVTGLPYRLVRSAAEVQIGELDQVGGSESISVPCPQR